MQKDTKIRMRWVAALFVPLFSAVALCTAPPDEARAISGAPPCADASELCVAVVRPPGGPLLLVLGGPKRQYFKRYELCVRAPDGTRECHGHRIAAPRYGHFLSAIAWRKHYTKRGPGRYVARWRRLPSERTIGMRAFFVR